MREAAVKRPRRHRSTACASGRSAAELHGERRRRWLNEPKPESPASSYSGFKEEAKEQREGK